MSSAVGDISRGWLETDGSDQVVGVVVQPEAGAHPPLSVHVLVVGRADELPPRLRSRIGTSLTVRVASENVRLPVRIAEHVRLGEPH